VIPDHSGPDPAGITRVLLTCGKIYYDAMAERERTGATDTAIVQVERLYPVPFDEIEAELAKYPAAREVIWVQDEPANMGAWPIMALKLPAHLHGRTLGRVSRPAGSSPAVGSVKLHQGEQTALLGQIFGEP
jgi:2-oxoglutarate dehydrogenase E1 component